MDILSDDERYGDLERILSAPEPLCIDPKLRRQSLNRPRRSLFTFRLRPTRPQSALHVGARQHG